MNFKHGKCYTSTYHIWHGMVARCTNPNCAAYPDYGARGITVCDAWLTFEGFYRDMGERPAGKSLERTDNSKGYDPANCVWASRKAQNRNKRSNVLLTIKGETLCMSEWAERSGIKYATIHQRFTKYGWSAERSVFTPLVHQKDRHKRKFGAERGVDFEDEREAA